MRILVTGSRDWEDVGAVYSALDSACVDNDLNYEPDEYGNTLPDNRKLTVVHGACPTGADMWADEWCISNWLDPERHPANWRELGKGAGFIRNAHMVNLGADLVLAFIRNASPGASHTAGLAEERGLVVRRFVVND